MAGSDQKKRCAWAQHPDADYRAYHDTEWGVPVHDDAHWFELLTLEGAQAGLSWATVLRKRAGYRRVFAHYDLARIQAFDDRRVDELMQDAGIVRNRLKIQSVIRNAHAFTKVQHEFGTFDAYIWGFVDGQPRVNRFSTLADVPASTPLSKRLSKDLLQRGFKFVGPTICYALMQAGGLVNDHETGCFRHAELS